MAKKTKKIENFLDKRYDFDIQKLMDNSNSYKSLIYGIVTVIVLFIVVGLGIRTLSQNKAQVDDGAVMTQKNQENQAPTDNKYEVKEGETLWSIAEKSYNDGFEWKEIAKANNITDPSTLEKGMRLVIPQILTQPAVQPSDLSPTPSQQIQPAVQNFESGTTKITGDTYVVGHGDYLWEIAVRAYGDGYRWVDIARANNLANPNLIFSGDNLKLPRP